MKYILLSNQQENETLWFISTLLKTWSFSKLHRNSLQVSSSSKMISLWFPSWLSSADPKSRQNEHSSYIVYIKVYR